MNDNVKTNRINLGNKWMLSGTGDKYANDDWLRLMSSDNKAQFGGFSANKLWSEGDVTVGNNLCFKDNGNTTFCVSKDDLKSLKQRQDLDRSTSDIHLIDQKFIEQNYKSCGSGM